MVERLQKVKPEDLTENSVLIGSPARITETLKKVEAAGFDEVILYFNVGMKPHAQVKEEMDRFMREVAPAFSAAHRDPRRLTGRRSCAVLLDRNAGRHRANLRRHAVKRPPKAAPSNAASTVPSANTGGKPCPISGSSRRDRAHVGRRARRQRRASRRALRSRRRSPSRSG